jgi:hypothetical protein
MMRTSIVALVAGFAIGSAGAKDYRVSEIQAIGEIRCNFHNEPSTEPCSDFKPPAKVAIGESFSAEGLRRVIRFVVATQVEEDYADRDRSIKKGQWFCRAAETSDDLGGAGASCLAVHSTLHSSAVVQFLGVAHITHRHDSMAGVRGLELGNVGFLESRPNSLVFRTIFVPETFCGPAATRP